MEPAPPHRPPPSDTGGAPSTGPRFTGPWWGMAALAITMGVYLFGGLCLATMTGETDAHAAGESVGMVCFCVFVPAFAGPILVWRKQALIGWIVTACVTILALVAAFFAVSLATWGTKEDAERDEWIEVRNADLEAAGRPPAYRREGGTVLVDGKALGRECAQIVAEASESLDWILLWDGVVCIGPKGEQSSFQF